MLSNEAQWVKVNSFIAIDMQTIELVIVFELFPQGEHIFLTELIVANVKMNQTLKAKSLSQFSTEISLFATT